MNQTKLDQRFFRISKCDLERKLKIVEESLKPLIDQVITPDPNYSSKISKGKYILS